MFTDELIDEMEADMFAWEDINSTLENDTLIPEGWMGASVA